MRSYAWLKWRLMGPQSALCNRFSVGHYPTLKFGRASDFGDGNAKLEELNGGHSTKEVIQWAGKQLATCGHQSLPCVACYIPCIYYEGLQSPGGLVGSTQLRLPHSILILSRCGGHCACCWSLFQGMGW